MKIGFFYQCGHRDNNELATYVVLKQLRKIYPLSSISIWEDCHFKDNNNNIYPLKKIAQEFNCIHHEIPYLEEYLSKNCHAVDLKTNLDYLDRIYFSINNELHQSEWIMLLEDDVWIQKEIKTYPDGDFCGHGTGSLLSGGVVFKRESFLKAYSLISNINWDKATNNEKVHTDHFLNLIFCNGNCIQSSYWNELGNFNINNAFSYAVLHGLKLFYKQPYGIISQPCGIINQNDETLQLQEAIKHPKVQQFINNYNVDIFT
jgi:hypothetical protein